MNLLMCSGNSPRNKDWILDVQRQISGLIDGSVVIDYRHWHTGDELIDLNYELANLPAKTDYLGEYGVFAKSIGTVLVVQALEKGILNPKFMVFCGIPLEYVNQSYEQFVSVLLKSEIPIVIIHNDRDTVGSSEDVKQFLGNDVLNKPNIKYIETVGNTHDYVDYDLIKSELGQLIEASSIK